LNAFPTRASGWHTLTTMLHLHRAERADRLADALATILSSPPSDPFTADVIAVPTRGMERWLTQRLSARLGASIGRADGVCANIDFPFPGRLIGGAIAVASGVEPDDDPWPPERSVWPLLAVAEECRGEPWLANLAGHLGGQRRFGQLRLIADLFDHYGIRRPGMLRAWARGERVDAAGDPLASAACWQPELWCRLRARIGSDSPAERLDRACARLSEDPSLLELPDRLSLFGLTRIPASYGRALSALAAGRDVHLFLLHPSPALWREVADATRDDPIADRARDTTARLARNRLLRSWGADSRELQLVLNAAGEHEDHHHEGTAAQYETLLHRIQADVVANNPPPGPPLRDQFDQRLELAPTDLSVTIHACHGPARQVEVLREAVMHLLAEDPTLEPRDVIVMCPDIETFAPLVQAIFGSASTTPEPIDEREPGRVDLRVRLADRSLRQTNPILAAVARLIELAELRLTASQLLDLAASEPVRRRFRFGDDDLARIQDWIVECGIRWGLDAAHRVSYRLEELPAGTWRAGLKRLLLGVAMSESGRQQFGQVLPLDDVESGDIELTGRFAEFVERVGVALDSFEGAQTASSWAAAISEAADSLTDTTDRDAWQRYELRTLLAEVVAEAGGAADTATIELAEVRSLLRHRLAGRPTRANFRTGHLTVCTLVPMRSVPHRVVCLLGLDDGAFPRRTARDGDDLLLDAPLVGDRDPRTEDRQLLLDALLAAEDRLLVLYSGADERTNAPRPPAVPVGELLDTIDRTARVGDADGRARDRVTVRHPLQPFDPLNFEPGTLVPGTRWGFDRSALEGARALTGPREAPPPFLPTPLPDRSPSATARIELDELIAFAERPVRAFLRQRLGISTSETDDEIEDGLPVELDGLDRWRIGQRVLDGMLAGYDSRVCFDAERARGALPPGKLGKPVADSLVKPLGALLGAAKPYTDADADARSVGINLLLEGGRRLTGSVSGIHDCVLLSVQFSRLNPRHRLAAWIRLLALAAHDPDTPYETVTIGRAPNRSYAEVAVARIPPLDGGRQRALSELAALVELRDRGLREPLPIAPNSSAAYAAAVASGEDPVSAAEQGWVSRFRVPGEDAEPENVRAFGASVAFAELLELPPAPDEAGAGWPAEESTRFGRCARRLWDPLLAVERLEFS
jgi:exodeoxyribonuclease V gamma subunit